SKSDLFAEVFRIASQREVDAMSTAAAATADGSAAERIAAGTGTFARRALARRRPARAPPAAPGAPASGAERRYFRHSYRDVIAEIVAEGVASRELPKQGPEVTGAALVGAIGETMIGPLSPTSNGGDPEALVASLIDFCTRAIGEE